MTDKLLDPTSKSDSCPQQQRRPTLTRKSGNRSYVELITEAILNSANQRLTANEIYERLTYNGGIHQNPASLKNTIRHTLSWYKRFKRVQRGTLQKPAWWTVDLKAETSKKALKASAYGHEISAPVDVKYQQHNGEYVPHRAQSYVYHAGSAAQAPSAMDTQLLYGGANHSIHQIYGTNEQRNYINYNNEQAHRNDGAEWGMYNQNYVQYDESEAPVSSSWLLYQLP